MIGKRGYGMWCVCGCCVCVCVLFVCLFFVFFFQAEEGIRDLVCFRGKAEDDKLKSLMVSEMGIRNRKKVKRPSMRLSHRLSSSNCLPSSMPTLSIS